MGLKPSDPSVTNIGTLAGTESIPADDGTISAKKTTPANILTYVKANTDLADLGEDATHRLVTDTEKSTWNGKQDALGFTPVDVADLGGAAYLEVGTTAGTVMAGNTTIPSITGLLDETAHDALDHTGLTGVPAAYTLPVATASVLGGVKQGTGTSIDANGVISVTAVGSGDVVGPASSTTGNVAVFASGTGKEIEDGGTLGTAAFADIGTTAGTVMAGDTVIPDTDNFEPLLTGATADTAPADADTVYGGDAGASFATIKTTWTNIKAFLKTYFDGVYAVLASPIFTGVVTLPAINYGIQSIATTGATTTFTSATPDYTIFTGTQGETVVLPNATTLALGRTFRIDNDSTQNIEVKTNGGAAFWIMGPGTDLYITCSSIATSAGTWEKDYNAVTVNTGGKIIGGAGGTLGTAAYTASTAYIAKTTLEALSTGILGVTTTTGALSSYGLDTDLSSVSASDDTIPSAKATKAMGDLKLPLAGGTMTGNAIMRVETGNYTTNRARNISLKTSTPSAGDFAGDGDIILVYTP